ncbi:adenosylcobinamide-phosphate synthase CbiB [Leucothrix arctica]|uniref:Cobalamin biosynthesis protein CobD n=1 Tax=Leucothrix arctica TaxID=1481894 RepID=A0A317CC05_9GAMM|nr:adenosylcobinamide-phosphate synthase CbiB [Leucothrix arctica]PWQ94863.1 cobalamin biosynthesis protein [Leucothrix arctica]
MLQLLTIPLSLAFDRVLGEPSRFHPLVGYGAIVDRIEKTLNHGNAKISKGVIAWTLAVIPIVFITWIIDQLLGGWWMSILCGYLAIGWQSLRQHGQWVEQALLSGDIATARTKLSWIVSRDTSSLNEEEISRGCIESLLENGSDAIFAPLFWLAIGGAPAVVLYRLCNTLDAMWGYRNDRYEQFGKFSARADDVLNLIPARLTAFSYALTGNFMGAMKAWRAQIGQWYSPNAGVVMATGAGALSISLGGNATYHGKQKSRPTLGSGSAPKAKDLSRALILIDRCVYLWSSIALILAGTYALLS